MVSNSLKLIAVVAMTGIAQGAQVCIAPAMPGPNGCTDCAADELNGSQCVRAGRWFGCYTTIEQCCKDPEVGNVNSIETCVRNYSKGDSKCDKAVSKDRFGTNTDCQASCEEIESAGKDPATDPSFLRQCMIEHFHVENGRVVTDGKCFNGWVHGYSEPANLAGYRQVEGVETPALCQKICQEDDDCVRFLWSFDSAAASQYDKGERCTLKNVTQVEVPAAIEYTSVNNPDNYDEKYCNYGMAHECWTDHYQCAPCEGGKKHCIWHSDKHVAGWKFCPDSDQCAVPGKPEDLTTEPNSVTATTAKPTSDVKTSIATTKPKATPTTAPRRKPTKHTSAATTTAKTAAPLDTTTATVPVPTDDIPTTQAPNTDDLTTSAPVETTNNDLTTATDITQKTDTMKTDSEPSESRTTTVMQTTTEVVPTPSAKSETTENRNSTNAEVTTTYTSSKSQATKNTITVSTRPHTPLIITGTDESSMSVSSTPTECSSTKDSTTRECRPARKTTTCAGQKCGGCHDCNDHACGNGCEEEHGLDLHIHDKPKLIRIAIDN